MYNNKGYYQSDSFDQSSSLKPSSKYLPNSIDRKSIENNNNYEKLNEKINDLHYKTNNNFQNIEMELTELNLQIQKERNENEELKSEILYLKDKFKIFEKKINQFDEMEIELKRLTYQNIISVNEIKILSNTLNAFKKDKDKELIDFIKNIVCEVREPIENKIEQLLESINNSFNKKNDRLIKIINDMSPNELTENPFENNSESETESLNCHSEESFNKNKHLNDKSRTKINTSKNSKKHVETNMDLNLSKNSLKFNEDISKLEESKFGHLKDNSDSIFQMSQNEGISYSMLNKSPILFEDTTNDSKYIFHDTINDFKSTVIEGEVGESITSSLTNLKSDLFGNTTHVKSTTSFENIAEDSRTALFGKTSINNNPSIFGTKTLLSETNKAITKPLVFSSDTKSTIFDTKSLMFNSNTTSIFGTNVKPSIFGDTTITTFESKTKPTLFGTNSINVISTLFETAPANFSSFVASTKPILFGNTPTTISSFAISAKPISLGTTTLNVSPFVTSTKPILFGTTSTNVSPFVTSTKAILFGTTQTNVSPFITSAKSVLSGINTTNFSPFPISTKPTLFLNTETNVKSNLFTNSQLDKKISLQKDIQLTKASDTKESDRSNVKNSIFGFNVKSTQGDSNEKSKGTLSSFNTPIFNKSTNSPTFLETKNKEIGLTASVFGNKSNNQSFVSVAINNKEKEFGSLTETKWQAGPKLFSNINKKEESDHTKEEELEEHDPDFKPIIDLPPLIEIIRDEDNKKVLFKKRGKLYRYDNEWKERGIGEIKVLQNINDGNVTILMRREQIHKLCCNQRVTKDSHKFTSMGSDKSVCWSGIDFSEGESKMETFAIKFGDEVITAEFKRVIAVVQSTLID